MNDNVQKLSALGGALLLILASLFYAQHFAGKIDSLRPADMGLSDYVPAGHQKVAERLWQDPFEAFNSLTNRPSQAAAVSAIPSNLTMGLSSSNSTATNTALTNYYTMTLRADSADVQEMKCHDLFLSLKENAGNNVHIFGVMLEAAPYPEDVEIRKRLRYSVETALLTTVFGAWHEPEAVLTPEDRSHIGAASVSLTNTYVTRGRTNLQMAFEWFNCDTRPDNKVLVLWLREDDFAVDSIWTLGNLLSTLTPHLKTNSVDFTLIGPRSSDTLRSFAASQPPLFSNTVVGNSTTNSIPVISPDYSPLWSNFKIFSPEATAPEANLWTNVNAGLAKSIERDITAGMIHKLPGLESVRLENWIATDDQLSSNLIQEIANRGNGNALDPKNVVVLVSEADTRFGRSLPRAFETALAARKCTTTNIWNFRYLRGLDGTKPATKPSEQKPAATGSTESLLASALETPDDKAEGEAQTDYAERLANYLNVKNRDLQRTKKGSILAVGLLGNDVYDKIILLQALRPKLKEALFFTTDLDARLWTPVQQLRSTRNLLVASSYSLDPEIEEASKKGYFLPFRDVYQAAVFNATRGAVLTAFMATKSSGISPNPANLTGHVFEIGYDGPVRLSPPPNPPERSGWRVLAAGLPAVLALAMMMFFTVRFAGWENFKKAFWALCRLLQRNFAKFGFVVVLLLCTVFLGPYEAKLFGAGLIATIGMTFLSTILLGGYHSKTPLVVDKFALPYLGGADDQSPDNPHWEEYYYRPPLSSIKNLLHLVLACCAAIAIACLIWRQPGEESKEMFAGVSIWPTEFIRILIIAISASVLFLTRIRNKHHCRVLWWDYMRERDFEKTLDAIKLTQQLDKGWDRVRNILTNEWDTPMTTNKKVDARTLLAGYLKRGLTRNRYIRTLPLAAAYLVMASAFVFLTGSMPMRLCVRGIYSWWYENIMLMASVVGFLIVLFYSLDAARLAAKLLDVLGRGPTDWPDQLTEEWSLKRGLRREDLSGLLDVQFAVFKTRETRLLMFAPFLIFLLLLVSREHSIADWHWSNGLIAVFAANFLLAALCWRIVRHSATAVRKVALKKLEETMKEVEDVALPRIVFKCQSQANPAQIIHFDYSKREYLKKLKALHEEIQNERRAAFAVWIQDPTYLALFIPTGVMGILSFLIQYWMTRP